MQAHNTNRFVFPFIAVVAASVLALLASKNYLLADTYTGRKIQSIDVQKQKPVILIHVGPPKTATTTTQTALTVWKNELMKDHYDYLGFHMWPDHTWKRYGPVGQQLGNPRCAGEARRADEKGEEYPDCWKSFMQGLIDYYNNDTAIEGGKRSMILSDEAWTRNRDIRSLDFKFLEEKVNQYYNLETVVTYRRLVDWYPSARRQILLRGHRKVWPKGAIQPLFPGIIRSSKSMSHNVYPSPLDIVNAYNQSNVTYRIFNFHESADIFENFVCNVLVDAKNTCMLSKMENATKIKMATGRQAKEDLLYDELITFAASNGIIDKTQTKRKEALNMARQHQEQVLNMTVSDFPMKCPPRSELEQYLQHSIEMERLVVPEFAARPGVQEEHAAFFWESVRANKFCSVDVEEVLKDPSWSELFRKQ